MSNGWNVYSECIDPDRADYGKAPTFEGWFADRAAWVEPEKEPSNV